MSRNRTNTAVRAALPLCFAVLAVGCAAEANLPAKTVLNHHHCEGLEPGVTRVDLSTVAAIRGSHLLSATGGDAAVEPDSELLMIAISRGQQTTAGYGWSLQGARVENATAVVDVEWQTPDPDAMVAQVITHPCLVVGLPYEGLSRVEVRDQAGEPVGNVDL